MAAHPVKALATGKNSATPDETIDTRGAIPPADITCSHPSARTLLVLLILLTLNVVASYDAILTFLLRRWSRMRALISGAFSRLRGLGRARPADPSVNVIVGSFPKHRSTRKILIVEDDPVTALAYAQCLRKAGYGVKVAGTGSQALAQVASWEPDGVLLDVLLPELNGIQVLTRIHAAAPHLPVVLCTNLFRPAVERSALAAGATRIFDKSTVKPLDLVSEFDRVFNLEITRLAA
jgi:CheY-like chemotaxis protein